MGKASKLLQMPILDGLYVDHCRFSCTYPQCSSCITKFFEYTAFLVGFTLNIKVKPGLNTCKALSMSLLDYMFELCFTSYLYLCFYVHAPFRFTPWSTGPLFEKYILNNKPSSYLSFQQINVVLGYKIATCSSNTGIVNSNHAKLATTLVGLSSIFCGFIRKSIYHMSKLWYSTAHNKIASRNGRSSPQQMVRYDSFPSNSMLPHIFNPKSTTLLLILLVKKAKNMGKIWQLAPCSSMIQKPIWRYLKHIKSTLWWTNILPWKDPPFSSWENPLFRLGHFQ